MIRAAQRPDTYDMARLHQAAFPNFFLTALGIGTLRVLYDHVVSTDHGVAFVAHVNGRTVGLVAGTTDLAEFRQEQNRSHAYKYAKAALPKIIRHPRLLGQLVAAVGGEGVVGDPTGAWLTSIAVDPAVARRGVGGELLQVFNTYMAGSGRKNYWLLTDAVGNDHVNDFYLSHGFAFAGRQRRRDGRMMNCYRMDLRND